MRIKQKAAVSADAKPQETARPRQPLRLLTRSQRAQLPYTLGASSSQSTSGAQDASKQQHKSLAEPSAASSSGAKTHDEAIAAQVSDALKGRFPPFLDVDPPPAPIEAAAVVDWQIRFESIRRHPTRSDVLLVPPACRSCIQLAKFCDRAPGRCGNCQASALSCCSDGHWQSLDAFTGRAIRGDATKHVVRAEASEKGSDAKSPRKRSDAKPFSQVKSPFWASSVDDMRQCDAGFPTGIVSMVTSRSGAVTTIVLRQGDIKWLPKLDLLVASIFTDQDSFDSLQAACAAKMLVKVYRVFDDEGKECRVLDESMALSKVTFLRTCCIHSVEREDTLQARVTLGSGISMDAVGGSNLMKITRFLHDSLVSLDEAEQTFLGFRCSVCGKANRRGSLIIASCTHCNTTFAITASCSSKSLSRKRAGNLQFTGPRSSLGQVNMVLSKDDVAQRFVSTFSDGTRLCTYHIVRSSSHNDSSSQARILSSSHTLHHILGPGQGDELSSESFALPSTPFIRLTSETEAKLRIQGYALSFGVQNQTWDQIYPRHRDFESASQGVLEQIAHLRRSLLLSDVPQGQSSKYHKPSGILLLLLQNSTLKIDSSMFPGPSSHFGIVSLSGSICVSIRRDKQAPNHSPARERQPKGVSVGSFVLQPQDTCVGRTDALQAIELELSSKGVTLWALAHFAQSTPTRSQ